MAYTQVSMQEVLKCLEIYVVVKVISHSLDKVKFV